MGHYAYAAIVCRDHRKLGRRGRREETSRACVFVLDVVASQDPCASHHPLATLPSCQSPSSCPRLYAHRQPICAPATSHFSGLGVWVQVKDSSFLFRHPDTPHPTTRTETPASMRRMTDLWYTSLRHGPLDHPPLPPLSRTPLLPSLPLATEGATIFFSSLLSRPQPATKRPYPHSSVQSPQMNPASPYTLALLLRP